MKLILKRDLSEQESAAFEIIKKLKENNFEAYWAGGVVRDLLLNQQTHDIDIATSADPKEISSIFPSAYDRGKSFGVMALKIGEFEFEIATFREDIGTNDHRRPEKVKFVSAQEDASRRDLTINGLFYDPTTNEIIDFIGGLNDLKNKTIRFIGKPEERIDEDYLRILRAIRFSCRLGFVIDPESMIAIKNNAEKVQYVSAERQREELTKILVDENRAKGIDLLDKTNLLKYLLPEILEQKNVPQPPEFHSEGDVWTHTLLACTNLGDIKNTEDAEEIAWAVLLHDFGKPKTIGRRDKIGKTKITFFEHDIVSAEMARKILTKFRFSHQFINKVAWAIGQHMRIVHAFRGMSERKKKQLFLDPRINILLELTRADLSASLRPSLKPEMDLYQDAIALKNKIEKETSLEEKEQVRQFDLINGEDIMKILNIPASSQVGKIKAKIEKAYLEGIIDTRKDALKELEKIKNDS